MIVTPELAEHMRAGIRAMWWLLAAEIAVGAIVAGVIIAVVRP